MGVQLKNCVSYSLLWHITTDWETNILQESWGGGSWDIFGLLGKLRSESKEIIKNDCFWTYLCYCLIPHRKKKSVILAEYIITGSTQFQYLSVSCIHIFAWYGNLIWSHKYIYNLCFEPWGTIVGKWQKIWYRI